LGPNFRWDEYFEIILAKLKDKNLKKIEEMKEYYFLLWKEIPTKKLS